jgi:hypothetical protein
MAGRTGRMPSRSPSNRSCGVFAAMLGPLALPFGALAVLALGFAVRNPRR